MQYLSMKVMGSQRLPAFALQDRNGPLQPGAGTVTKSERFAVLPNTQVCDIVQRRACDRTMRSESKSNDLDQKELHHLRELREGLGHGDDNWNDVKGP